MIRFTFIVTTLFTILNSVFGQSDTIFFNQDWVKTTRDSAQFYRPPMAKVENGYLLKDYYMTGVLQMEGVTTSPTEEFFDGQTTWYYPNGKVSQKKVFKNNILDGNITSYREDGTVIASAEYKEGIPISGTVGTEEYGTITLHYFENDKLVKSTVTSIQSSSKAMICWTMLDSVNSKMSQYNQFGEFVGDFFFRNPNFEYVSGVMATYSYNPMVVAKITYISNGMKDKHENWYYTNGKLKKVERFGGESSYDKSIEFSYDKNGILLDSLTYKDGTPFNGTKYDFYERYLESKLEDQVEKISPYSNGELKGTVIEYYSNGVKRSQMEYNKGRAEGYYLEYDTLGNEKEKVLFKDDRPWEGELTDDYLNSTSTYKAGVLVLEKGFHSNGKPSIYKDLNIEVCYDTLGVVLARLEKKDGEPYNGVRAVAYNGVVSSTTEYIEGYESVLTNYVDGVIIEKVEFAISGDIYKRTEYYTNGAIKFTALMDGYSEKEKLFFSKDGTPMGKLTYDSDLGYNGEQIKFDSDSILSIEVYENDKIIKKKVYNNEGVMVCDIDYNGASVVYDLPNNKEYRLIYKDGLPFEGTEVNQDEYSYAILAEKNYKNGLLDGQSIVYTLLDDYTTYAPETITNYSQGNREGVEKTFINGVLASEVTYSKDFANGTALFYDAKGKLIGKATNKEGAPMDGVLYEFDSLHQPLVITPYSNGTVNGEVKYFTDNKLDYTYTFVNNQTQKRVTYVDGKPKYTLIYKDDQKFEGEERNYNTYSQYKNGVETLYLEYSYDQPELVVKRREYVGDVTNETIYYSNGIKKSVHTLVGDEKVGEATFFDINGKEVARGNFVDNFPASGSFAFFNSSDDSAYLKLELLSKKMVVTEFSNGLTASTFQYDLRQIDSAEMQRAEVERFLNGLRTMYENYSIESYY